MRKRDRKRHKLVRFAAGVSEHHTLIARAHRIGYIALTFARFESLVYAHGDIARLLVDGGENGAVFVVESVSRVGVSDVADCLARYLLNVDISLGGKLAHYDDETGSTANLARDTRHRIARKRGVKHAVRYTVANLVGMAFGYRFA